MRATKIFLLAPLCLGFSALFACGNSDAVEDEPGTVYSGQKGEPIDGIRIGWDYSTLQQLSAKGGYPRSIRLQDGAVMAVYEDYETGYAMRRSVDVGVTWQPPVTVFRNHHVTNDQGSTQVNMANPEIIQLANGDLLAACNYRPQTPEITPFSIAVCRSTDNGATWSNPQVIYEAKPRFSDGCWEPSFLQLPNGDVQVYFANEGPYTHSDEQEISVLTSHDNGQSWGEFKTVCFRAGSRDGMPVSKVVDDEIVCVIEDCGFTTFKPYTVRTKLAASWASPVWADSPDRCMALGEPVEDWVYMGAPYLEVLSTGETLLSYQVDYIRHDGDRLPYSVMEVAIGDKKARNFIRRTCPIPLPSGKHAVWPSVVAWDANTVVALASSNYQGSIDAPTLIKGHVMRDITVNSIGTAESIFIGHSGKPNLRAGVRKDKTNLYVTCKVQDEELYSAGKGTQRGSGIFLCLDTQNTCLKEPAEGTYKIWCSYNGDSGVWEGYQGKWKSGQLEGLHVSSSIVKGGYEVTFMIPLKNSFNKEEMRIGATLSTKYYVEDLVHSGMDSPNTWMRMSFNEN